MATASTFARLFQVSAPERTTVEEIRDRLWVILPHPVLVEAHTGEFRDACLQATDCGALDVIVDLTEVEQIGDEALGILEAVAASLLARGGYLWLANAGARGYRFAIVPVDEHGLGQFLGHNVALDDALLADCDQNDQSMR